MPATITHQYIQQLLVGAVIALWLISTAAHAQVITAAEYFFNTDPGQDNATPLSIPSGSDVTFTRTISTASLPQGFHILGLRVKESPGTWSLFETRGFYITAGTTDVANITAAEYFFNSDPGPGNGTSIPVTPGSAVTFTIPIPTSSLGEGFHFLSVRTRDASGRWGLFEARGFLITQTFPDVPNLAAAEYFFDSDPGQGNGTPITITGSATANFTIPVPTGSLSPGFHFLAIRLKGADGRWGLFEARGFYISEITTDVPDIVAAEYFIDNDPGIGSGLSITPITAGSTVNFVASIPSSTAPGFHFLSIRVKQANGTWGLFETRGFYVSPDTDDSADLVAAEYYFGDTDPGEGNGIAVNSVIPGPVIIQDFDLPVTGLGEGPQTINLRVQDASGIWSTAERQVFTVLNCIPPDAPTAPSQSRCDEGTVTLTASGAVDTQVYRWYASANEPTILFTGASFTTPELSATTIYYVSIFDPGTLCESIRTAVTATVIILPQPVLNISSVNLCEGSSILISAPEGYSNYAWSNGETTREILVTTSGEYSVTVSEGTCTTVASAPAVVTLISRPPRPEITSSGTTSLCDGSTVTLTAPAGFAYLWSNGETMQSITVITSGNYTVTVTNASGCASASSDAVTVMANTTPPKPVIEVLGSTTLCGTNTVALLAPLQFAALQWSSGQTTPGITVSASGSYTVRVGNASNCLSEPSDPVTVTNTGQPCMPVGSTNSPPAITQTRTSVKIEGRLEFDLTKIITDTDNNIDFNTLRVVGGITSRGVNAFVDAAYFLQVDYSGNPFTGTDRVTIEVCDLALACVQQVIDIDVVGSVIVFNGITPDGDGYNDFMLIKYIDVVEGALQNKVTVFNRWGDKVFETENYNNTDRTFYGQGTSGSELPSGTYFYKVEFVNGAPTLTGYLTILR